MKETNLTADILGTAHTLIAGATGCGKSVLIHHTICEALQQPTAAGELFLIDLKNLHDVGCFFGVGRDHMSSSCFGAIGTKADITMIF